MLNENLSARATCTILLHTVTTFRIFIKSSEEGGLDCPKYRENQFSRSFSLSLFEIVILRYNIGKTWLCITLNFLCYSGGFIKTLPPYSPPTVPPPQLTSSKIHRKNKK